MNNDVWFKSLSNLLKMTDPTLIDMEPGGESTQYCTPNRKHRHISY